MQILFPTSTEDTYAASMSEIGSEFWDVPVVNTKHKRFPKSTQWFLSGRSALQAIIQELKGCNTVSIPSWCCDSMIKPFYDAGMEVHFYPVYWQDRFVQNISFSDDALYLIDYFGYTSSGVNLNTYTGVVIRDVTHSFFSAEYDDADFIFGSLRKWCGVWTGGFAWARDGHQLFPGEVDKSGYSVIRRNAMEKKHAYLQNVNKKRDSHNIKKDYLDLFQNAEAILESCGIAPGEDRDSVLAEHLDILAIQSRRRENARVLMEALRDWLIFPDLGDQDCPMFVPVLVPDGRRNALKEFLIANSIYCPVHWPVSKLHALTEAERFLYDNELSLICDQRYSENDMHRLISAIHVFWKGV